MSSSPLTTRTLGELVAEKPGLARVFERFSLDYCCNGGHSLEQACGASNAELAAVEAAIAEFEQAAEPCDEPDCASMTLTELVDHLEATHHKYLRLNLPELDALVEKVFRAHGRAHQWLTDFRRVYKDLCMELSAHLDKEEMVLFPMIRELETATAAPSFHCGSVGNPIHVMEMEHDGAGMALKKMRQLTSDYAAPADTCASFQSLMQRVEELEYDIHRHIHKENSILHPKAKAREAELHG